MKIEKVLNQMIKKIRRVKKSFRNLKKKIRYLRKLPAAWKKQAVSKLPPFVRKFKKRKKVLGSVYRNRGKLGHVSASVLQVIEKRL